MSSPTTNGALRKRLHQPWFGGGVGAALCCVFGLALLLLPFGKGLRDWSYDLPFLLRPEKVCPDIAIIYLDDESYRKMGQSPAEFDRGLYAKLIRQLKAEGAKLVVFDVLFVDTKKSSTDADRQLAAAMRESGRVVLGGQLHRDDFQYKNVVAVPPIDVLRDACAGWGLAMVNRDPDFGVRRHFPGTEQIPSLAWAAAKALNAGAAKQPANRAEPRWLNYYSHEPIQGFPYYAVAFDRTQMPRGYSFKDKIVFIGAYTIAGYTGDEKEECRSPWTWVTGHFHLGVEIHALTLANLIHHDWISRFPGIIEALIILLTGGVIGYGLTLFRPMAATGIALLLALGTAAAAFGIFAGANFWFPWLIIVAVQIPLALAWAYLFYSIKSHIETTLLTTSLSFYLSPQQVAQILKQPDLLKPGASQQTVSILFSDIASFSKISERMDAADLVKLLNEYYEAAIGRVHETDGTIMDLIGDAIFAIWNAPQAQADHQARACRAALRLNEQLVQFDAAGTHLPMRTRIGLHTGTVHVGNIGSSTHFDYTAIGESVNLASRLEGLNKTLGTEILATRDIQKSVESQIVSRLVGHFRFKGFDRVIEVYELICPVEKSEGTAAWREAFKNALWNFQRKNFDQADEGFRQTLQLREQDGPAKFYLERIAELKSRNLSPEWMGEIDLREK